MRAPNNRVIQELRIKNKRPKISKAIMENQLSMDHPIAISRTIIKWVNKDPKSMLKREKPDNGK